MFEMGRKFRHKCCVISSDVSQPAMRLNLSLFSGTTLIIIILDFQALELEIHALTLIEDRLVVNILDTCADIFGA